MSLPFTRDQFLEVFRSYNTAIGLAPLVLLALAFAVLVLAYSQRTWRHRGIAALLALLWLWSGVVYHWGFFAAINPAAKLFGALFVAQAVLLIVLGVIRGEWQFDPRQARTAGIGWLLIIYALMIYPLLGWMFGHGYPNGPSFGAPCPITIFFLGTTLWIAGSASIPAAIPVLWSLVGTSAAVALGVHEDFALGLSAVIVVIAIVRQRTAARRLTQVIRPLPATKGTAIGLLLAVLLSSCTGSGTEAEQARDTVVSSQGDVIADDRVAIQVDSAARGLILQEMRILLNAVQGVVGGAARTDTALMRAAAASAGMTAAAEADDRVAAQLGTEFMLLGTQTHLSFDSLAADVTRGENRDVILKRLSSVMGNCVGCHNRFRLILQP